MRKGASRIVQNPDPSRLALKSGRMRVDAIAEKMAGGSSVFVSDMGRQLASYYKKRLGQKLGVEVTADPAIYDDTDGHRLDGYRFRTALGKKK